MTNNSQHRLLRSAPLLMPAVALVGGIVAGQYVEPSTCWLLFFGLFLTAIALYRFSRSQSVMLLLTVAALGAVRSSTVRQQHEQVTWPDATVSYEAVVVSEPVAKPKTTAVDMIIVGDGRKVKAYIARDSASSRLAIGQRLQLCSHIERNHDWHQGTFDYRRYLEVHGFAGQTFVRQGDWQRLTDSWEGLPVWQRLRLHFLCYRHSLLERYRAMGIDDEAYAVVAAMTLGDKSAMSRELRDVYAVSGASHVLALSGLHLGIIYMLLSLLVVGRRWRFVTQLSAVAGIWAFALLVGLPSSVVRAAVMISVYALLSLVHRGRPSLNALSLAALVILIVSPYSLYDVGFQLSFAAMLAIVTIQPLLEGMVSREWLFDHSVLRWLWGLATISVAAQVGTAPLVAYYFGRFSTYFLLTNFVVIPATTLILYLALAALITIHYTIFFSEALLMVVGWLNSALTLIAVRLPCRSIEGLRPSMLQTAMVYVIIISLYQIIIRYDKHL